MSSPSEAYVRESLAKWTKELREKTRQRNAVQRVLHRIRARRQRSARMVRKRKRQLARIEARQTTPRNVIDKGLTYLGVTESPAGSNRGPAPIDECQREFGFAAVAWCACFTGWLLRRVAG